MVARISPVLSWPVDRVKRERLRAVPRRGGFPRPSAYLPRIPVGTGLALSAPRFSQCAGPATASLGPTGNMRGQSGKARAGVEPGPYRATLAKAAGVKCHPRRGGFPRPPAYLPRIPVGTGLALSAPRGIGQAWVPDRAPFAPGHGHGGPWPIRFAENKYMSRGGTRPL